MRCAMLLLMAALMACGKGHRGVVSEREVARMYVAALSIDSLKSKYKSPEQYPEESLDEIGRSYGLTARSFRVALKKISADAQSQATLDSLIRVAIDEATIRTLNEKDTIKD